MRDKGFEVRGVHFGTKSIQIDTAALMIVDNGKVGLDLVLDGDTIKWYDPEGTLGGKGDYSRIN